MFQARFAGQVKAGFKRQTIRKTARCKAGDVLSLRTWTGKPYRSKQELLREEECKAVRQVNIRAWSLKIDGVWTSADGMDMFAQADGFTTWEEMHSWFENQHGLPFEGVLIEW